MTVDDIQKMIADNEGDVFEYKATTGQRVDGCRTLCAFLNGRGGTVVFGVTKEGKLTGQLVSEYPIVKPFSPSMTSSGTKSMCGIQSSIIRTDCLSWTFRYSTSGWFERRC